MPPLLSCSRMDSSERTTTGAYPWTPSLGPVSFSGVPLDDPVGDHPEQLALLGGEVPRADHPLGPRDPLLGAVAHVVERAADRDPVAECLGAGIVEPAELDRLE